MPPGSANARYYLMCQRPMFDAPVHSHTGNSPFSQAVCICCWPAPCYFLALSLNPLPSPWSFQGAMLLLLELGRQTKFHFYLTLFSLLIKRSVLTVLVLKFTTLILLFSYSHDSLLDWLLSYRLFLFNLWPRNKQIISHVTQDSQSLRKTIFYFVTSSWTLPMNVTLNQGDSSAITSYIVTYWQTFH